MADTQLSPPLPWERMRVHRPFEFLRDSDFYVGSLFLNIANPFTFLKSTVGIQKIEEAYFRL